MNTKFLVKWLSILLISIILIFTILYESNPLTVLNLKYNKSEISEILKEFEKYSGKKFDSLQTRISLNEYHTLVNFILNEYPDNEKEKLNNDHSAFFWEIKWHRLKREGNNNNSNEQLIINKRDSEIPLSKTGFLHISSQGILLEYFFQTPDSLDLPEVDSAKADSILKTFLIKYAKPFQKVDITNYEKISSDILLTKIYDNVDSIKLIESNLKIVRNTKEYIFKFSGHNNLLNIPVIFSAVVKGNKVSNFSYDYQINNFTAPPLLPSQIGSIATAFVVAIIVIMLFVVGIRRLRSYEIGFMQGIIFAIFGFIFVAAQVYFRNEYATGLETFLPPILSGLFVGATLIFIWPVSESIGREIWGEKFLSLDLSLKGFIFESKTGKSIIRGITLGFVLLVVYFTLNFLLDFFYPLYSHILLNEILAGFSLKFTYLELLAKTGFGVLFFTIFFFVFLISYIRLKTSDLRIVFIIPVFVYSLATLSNSDFYIPSIIISLITSLFLVWTYFKYDFITIFLANYISSLFYILSPLIMINNDELRINALLISSIFFIILLIGIIGVLTKDKLKDTSKVIPSYALHITERQRLKKELEIARKVHFSLLPKNKPKLDKIDFAAICIPANEVGGDYYDFVEIDNDRIAIIIGDVSGKGIQAAFYMTLVKGFFRSLIQNTTSSSQLLLQMNKLFCENVEKGTFISMIYGIFDLKNNTLNVSRAGHNPLVVSSDSEVKFIHQEGLAIGLDNTSKFNDSIEEKIINLKSEDVFIFYTDGFTETLSKNKEFYGDDRLLKILANMEKNSAQTILDSIIKDVNKFADKSQQPDDMTAVVIRIR